jgi:hypothetical protein
LYNAEDAMQDDILWDDRERTGENASASVRESVSEESLDKLSDYIKMIERNVHVVKILNFHFILLYFPLHFTLNLL